MKMKNPFSDWFHKAKGMFSRLLRKGKKNSAPISLLISSDNPQLSLKEINKEFHFLVNTIEELSKTHINSQYFYNSLIDMRDVVGLILDNKGLVLSKIHNKENVKLQIISILNWLRVSLDKLISQTDPENFNNETMHSLLKFCYESTWKLIIIFEEVLGVPCSICSKNGRVVVYSHVFQKNDRFLEESRIIEKEIVDAIRQLDV